MQFGSMVRRDGRWRLDNYDTRDHKITHAASNTDRQQPTDPLLQTITTNKPAHSPTSTTTTIANRTSRTSCSTSVGVAIWCGSATSSKGL